MTQHAGAPLAPTDECLFRQVPGRPGYVDDGEPTSLAFKPMPKDNGELSVDLQSHTTAQESFERFLASGLQTDGTWAVTTHECSNIGLPCHHKPKTTPPENHAHGVVDFTVLPKAENSDLPKDKDLKKKAARLAEFAIARGRQWPVPQAPAAAVEQPVVEFGAYGRFVDLDDNRPPGRPSPESIKSRE